MGGSQAVVRETSVISTKSPTGEYGDGKKTDGPKNRK